MSNASPAPLTILFAGSGEFGLPTFRALLDAGHRVPLVISQPDRPAGRGMKLTPTPVSQLATERGLPLVRTDDINREPLPPADLLLVIAFGQKIAPHVVNHARLGAINLHSSRLPKYRGAAPINWAVINGDAVSGNSVIRLAEKMDAGAVLGMSELPIGELETAGELHDRLSADGATLVPRVIQELSTGTSVETQQDHTQATVAKKLSRESTKLDFARPAAALACQVRGMYPWPGCRVRVMDGDQELSRVTLVRARGIPGSGTPGTITADHTIATGDGAIEVVELQPEGKKPMSLAAFRNGRRWDAGLRVESIA
jgi:methionyl-tRNA formyltransferase